MITFVSIHITITLHCVCVGGWGEGDFVGVIHNVASQGRPLPLSQPLCAHAGKTGTWPEDETTCVLFSSMGRAPLLILLLQVCLAPGGWTYQFPRELSEGRLPVIIDTDIGSDIDDSFAIVYAAQCSNLDVKLVVTCTDDTTARAKITAKLLTIIGRDQEIPIGIGVRNDNRTAHTLFEWASDFDLSAYKGGVYEDGVDQMGKIITASPTVVNIIAIGPMTNFPDLLKRYPNVTKNARIWAMAGSVYRGYNNNSHPSAEYNVYMCTSCMQLLLAAGWQGIVFTPLDTCGTVRLGASLMAEILAGENTTALGLASSLMYFCIFTNQYNCTSKGVYPILFDTNAVLLMEPEAKDFIDFQELRLSVNDKGYTVIDNDHGAAVQVALNWKSNGLESFEEKLAKVLTG